MSLTNNNLAMIKAIANNDIHSARVSAIASLAEDTSKKNEATVSYYKKMLVGNAAVLMSNLPNEIKTFLVGEAPDCFDATRYYLREHDKDVLYSVRKMKLIADEMSRRRIAYRNTTLLYGESGTGKTEFARYLAHQLNMPFFYVSFAATVDSYLGSTAKNIHKIFEFCNAIPCVLMLDEVDCVAARRSAGVAKGADGELERTTISIMQELDTLPNHVTLIAATNRIDLIDEALLRRFSIRHEMTPMTQAELHEMAKQFLAATETEKYFKDEELALILARQSKPGDVLPIITRVIGEKVYEERKDEFETDADDTVEQHNVWCVKYEWINTVAAQSEEDAIAIARGQRLGYAKEAEERYSAEPAKFFGPSLK